MIATGKDVKPVKKSKELMIPNEYTIQTLDHWFDYEVPENSTMTLAEIANSLSNVCRWGGHIYHFFSVAQHALLVASLTWKNTGDYRTTLYALHHDDHEAVRGDIPTPRKRYLKKHNMLFPGEEAAEDKWIFGTLLGLDWPVSDELWTEVKRADLQALFTERAYLKPRMKWHENDYKEVPPLTFDEFQVFDQRRDDAAEWFLETHEKLLKAIEEDKK